MHKITLTILILFCLNIQVKAQTYELNDSIFTIGSYLRTYNIIFEFNTPAILTKSYKELDSFVDFLNANNRLQLKIKVHSDSRGSDSFSRCLTCKRAESIAEYLIHKGIQTDRLLPIGVGEVEPITIYNIDSLTNDTLSTQILTQTYINSVKEKSLEQYEELQQLNQRVEFEIIATDYVSQNSNYVHLDLIDSLHGLFTNFSVDNFGNIYTTNKDVLVKYSPKLKMLFSASLKSLLPTSIESSKSFRVLIFDKERGIINFLDNTLTDVKGEIDLADLDVLQTVLVCESFNGNSFWVLDEGGQQLLKVNQNLDIITRVDNLNYLFKDRTSPIQMFEHNDELIIHFPGYGVALFDVFGTYIQFYPIVSTFIDLKNDFLFSLDGQNIKVFKLPLMDHIASINLSDQSSESFKIMNQKLYLKTLTGLFIYSIKNLANNK